MADGYVAVAPDSTGKKVDTSELVVGGLPVERQRIVLADPADPAGIAVVLATAPAGTEHGLVTRPIMPATVHVTVDNPTTQVAVSGTVAVSSLPGSPAQDTTVATVTASLGADGATPPALPGGATGVRGWLRGIYALLGGKLTVTADPISFAAPQHVDVDNFPATQTVTGTVNVGNLPATQPVSEAHLPNLDIALSVLRDAVTKTGATTKTLADVVAALQATLTTNATVENWPATQAVSGSVSVSNLPATQPVSGSVSVSNLPATQPVSGGVTVTNLPAEQGVWHYHAGVSGTLAVPAGERVIGLVAHCSTGTGSVVINGGDSIPVPSNVGLELEPKANLTAPSVTFTGTDVYLVETVS